MSPKTLGLLFWLIVISVAAGVVYWELRHPPQLLTINQTAKRPPDLPVVEPIPPFHLPPLGQYTEIVARTAFVSTRRPEPPPPPEEEVPSKPVAVVEDQKFMLLGVVITPNLRMALIRPDTPNAKTARIKIGDTIGEWRLEAILPNRVVIRKDQAQQELALVRPKKVAGPKTKRNGPKPGSDSLPSLPVEPPTPVAPDGLPPLAVPPAQPPQDG